MDCSSSYSVRGDGMDHGLGVSLNDDDLESDNEDAEISDSNKISAETKDGENDSVQVGRQW